MKRTYQPLTEREETNTVSAKEWLLQTVAEYWLHVVLKVVKKLTVSDEYNGVKA